MNLENTIVCGDCLDILKQLPDHCVDLVLTDPPYGIDYQSARRVDKSKWMPKIANDTSPFIDWIEDASRVLRNGGRLLCFYRWDVQEAFLSEIKRVGLAIKSQIVWDKVVHGMGDLRGAFAPQHENIIYATKGRYVFQGKRPCSVIRQQKVSPGNLLHPNEKPVELLKTLIRPLTVEGDVVLDCFCGSGSTGVASVSLGRRYIGIDISSEYCEIARNRIKEEQLIRLKDKQTDDK